MEEIAFTNVLDERVLVQTPRLHEWTADSLHLHIWTELVLPIKEEKLVSEPWWSLFFPPVKILNRPSF